VLITCGRPLLLVFLGTLGWQLFLRLRLPVPGLLGAITIISSLRALGFDLAYSPPWFSPLVQVTIGLIVGAKVTRETFGELKRLFLPAFLIASWSIGFVFLLGHFLAKVAGLDTYTALLAASMGGLAEMTVLALSTGADVSVVIVMQTVRMVATSAVFPLILHKFIVPEEPAAAEHPQGAKVVLKPSLKDLTKKVGGILPSYLVAAIGGTLCIYLGIPAGAMIGALVFTGAASLLGFPVNNPGDGVFEFVLVILGIVIADDLSPSSFAAILSGGLAVPLLLTTALIFFSSFAMAFLIQRISKMGFPTCFLAAAPGGFSVMTSYAIKYDQDPLSVSLLHLIRLISLKLVIPIAYLLWS
jgi:membrane AbrB-like protein